MNSSKKITVAFILNLAFSVFEFFGGILTGSVAILSDALHDMGDAASIGLSLFLEKKSLKAPDKKYTYGYRRFSVTGGLITSLILLTGSVAVIVNAIDRLINPVSLNYDGMIAFAIAGTAMNFAAAYLTHGGESVNTKAINLHMLEDVLGWVTVLIGAVIMKFTDFSIIDPLMSIGVSLFIMFNSIKNLKEIFEIFNMKTPHGLSADEIKKSILSEKGIEDVHHIHLWSMDGVNHYASMHIVTDGQAYEIKNLIRKKMSEYGINHITIETEKSNDHCHEKQCRIKKEHHCHCHHH